jgi:hypothetical protein
MEWHKSKKFKLIHVTQKKIIKGGGGEEKIFMDKKKSSKEIFSKN